MNCYQIEKVRKRYVGNFKTVKEVNENHKLQLRAIRKLEYRSDRIENIIKVLDLLKTHAVDETHLGVCYPTKRYISKNTGICMRTIRYILEILVELKFIRIVETKRPTDRMQSSNIYIILPIEKPKMHSKETHVSCINSYAINNLKVPFVSTDFKYLTKGLVHSVKELKDLWNMFTWTTKTISDKGEKYRLLKRALITVRQAMKEKRIHSLKNYLFGVLQNMIVETMKKPHEIAEYCQEKNICNWLISDEQQPAGKTFYNFLTGEEIPIKKPAPFYNWLAN